MGESNCIVNALIVGLLLNYFIPLMLTPLATPDEVTPPDGAGKLSFKSQFMHLMVHHNQIPLMSALVVGFVIITSIYLGYKLNPMKRLLSLKK